MLLSLLWDDICEPIWKTRCRIKHDTTNFSTVDEMSSLAEKLMWYQRHQDEVLDYRHRFLINYTLSDIERWTRITRTSKVTILDNAMRFHKTECEQSAQQQSTIYDWLRVSSMHGTSANAPPPPSLLPTYNQPLRMRMNSSGTKHNRSPQVQ